ncbi:MAG: recombinase family protein [Planctomycetaceae bacterium]|nr:recombinase family protein [Planctomycetaceae bacterium]
MKIGYARISTADQNACLQRDALKLAGCEKIITEKVSGASVKRPKLEKLLRSLDAGDVLTVWRLDRVGRSLPHLLDVVANLTRIIHHTYPVSARRERLAGLTALI